MNGNARYLSIESISTVDYVYCFFFFFLIRFKVIHSLLELHICSFLMCSALGVFECARTTKPACMSIRLIEAMCKHRCEQAVKNALNFSSFRSRSLSCLFAIFYRIIFFFFYSLFFVSIYSLSHTRHNVRKVINICSNTVWSERRKKKNTEYRGDEDKRCHRWNRRHNNRMRARSTFICRMTRRVFNQTKMNVHMRQTERDKRISVRLFIIDLKLNAMKASNINHLLFC